MKANVKPAYFNDNTTKINPNLEEGFKVVKGTTISQFFPRLYWLILILIMFFILMLFLPWIQTSMGSGQITALHPEDRIQQIVSPVTGRVKQWYVRDGSKVKFGDKIAQIIDIDPYFIERLQADVNLMYDRLHAIKVATNFALINYHRQLKLYTQGLSAKKDYEAAVITYQKSLADQKYYQVQLIKSQSTLAKQLSQNIFADRDGIIVSTLASSNIKVIKAGDILATFLPKTTHIAVEMYINGNDVPLVTPGRQVRLVFDGWPSVQFSGWPSISVGTFGGIVKVVDSTASPNGLFRVLVEPDSLTQSWPSKIYLRMGVQVQGYIQLNKVMLGYEIWRQLNGFPIAINNKTNAMTLDEDILSTKEIKDAQNK